MKAPNITAGKWKSEDLHIFSSKNSGHTAVRIEAIGQSFVVDNSARLGINPVDFEAIANAKLAETLNSALHKFILLENVVDKIEIDSIIKKCRKTLIKAGYTNTVG